MSKAPSGKQNVKPKGGSAAVALSVVLVVQAIAAVFFVGDVIADLTFDSFDLHVLLEMLVSAALVLGVVFGARATRQAIEDARRRERALDVARGALGDLIESSFKTWGLSAAEAEVAMLALKGFDSLAIAQMRGTAHGTVRAQLAKVYAKAGVSSRTELMAYFMDDLLDGPLEAPLQG